MNTIDLEQIFNFIVGNMLLVLMLGMRSPMLLGMRTGSNNIVIHREASAIMNDTSPIARIRVHNDLFLLDTEKLSMVGLVEVVDAWL